MTFVRLDPRRPDTAVHGSSPRHPAVLAEDAEPGEPPGRGHAKDASDAEGYVRGFAGRRGDVAVPTLRFANFTDPAPAPR